MHDIPPTNHSSLSERLTAIFQLAQEVWLTFNQSDKLTQIEKLLHLETSSICSTFRCDLAILTGTNLPTSICVDSQPFWLKTQLVAQEISSAVRGGLTPAIFDDILRSSSQMRLQIPPQSHQLLSLRNTQPRICFAWNDFEIFGFFCDLIIHHLKLQPLDRVNDEYLSVVFTLIQPVVERHLPTLQQIFTVLQSRSKFTFKQFFDYIVLPEIIMEFSGFLGKVTLELRVEQQVVGVSTHKTRGANRESTEALQTEFQRHMMLVALNSSPFRTVQTFLRNEREVISRVLFSPPNLSPKRARGNVT